MGAARRHASLHVQDWSESRKLTSGEWSGIVVQVLSKRRPSSQTDLDRIERFANGKSLICKTVNTRLRTETRMCKAVDRGMTINDVKVLEKHGGKSGDWVANP
ncbi:hypothetical protein [Paraburkholderia saeva]|uniref:hypothetical protein n=1 Tax=Paraburkholderia saeva TaxID=2777537 RepID=UPI0038991018